MLVYVFVLVPHTSLCSVAAELKETALMAVDWEVRRNGERNPKKELFQHLSISRDKTNQHEERTKRKKCVGEGATACYIAGILSRIQIVWEEM